MKQLIQNYKTGNLTVENIPVPKVQSDGIVVQTLNSVISIGTEENITSFAKSSLISKAKARPDLVKQFLNKTKKEGFFGAFRQAMNKLDKSLPLGYSSVGQIVEIGRKVKGFDIADRVAIFGTGFAPHAEYTAIPADIAVKVPQTVDNESAAFTSLGAIAINGIRNANVQAGNSVAVIGLGMIGFLTALILKEYKINVAVFDINRNKLKKAEELNIKNCFCSSDGIEEAALGITNHKGFDAVIITASTKTNQPMELAAEICRFRGRIVLVGVVGLNIPRKPFYEKEVEFIVSKNAGPTAEKKLSDVHNNGLFSHRDWTQKANMQEFLSLVQNRKLYLKPLITHKVDFDTLLDFYNSALSKKSRQKCLGAVIYYRPQHENDKNKDTITITGTENPGKRSVFNDKINIGLIGAGEFARNVFLPFLLKNKNIALKGVASSKGISAQQVVNRHASGYATTDYHKILEDEDISTVFITTRHNLHASMVIEALAKGKNVFVEKPLCINERELDDIAKAWYKANSGNNPPVLMVGLNRRFSEFAKKAKDFLGKHSATSKIITIRANAGYIHEDHWTQNDNIGGGRIIGEVCHYIDLVNYFTESSPSTVYASLIGDSVKRDNLLINLEYTDGSIANICYCSNGTKSCSRERTEIFCNHSICIIEDFKEMMLYRGKIRQKKRKFNRDMGYKQEITAFVNAIRGIIVTPVAFEDYYSTTITTFKIEESLNKSKKIQIGSLETSNET